MTNIVLLSLEKFPELDRFTRSLSNLGYPASSNVTIPEVRLNEDISDEFADKLSAFDTAVIYATLDTRESSLWLIKTLRERMPVVVLSDKKFRPIFSVARRHKANDCIRLAVPETTAENHEKLADRYVKKLSDRIIASLKRIKIESYIETYPPLKYMRKFHIEIKGIIHVGAHKGQEIKYYEKLKGKPVKYFEAVPRFAEEVRKNITTPNITVYEACCSEADDEIVEFNIASHAGGASSMLPMAEDWCAPAISYVDKFQTKTSRLESLLDKQEDNNTCNLMVIDAQGADLNVIKGLGKYLKYIDGIYVEASDKPLYVGGCNLRELFLYLDDHGFALMELEAATLDWGDAFFVNRRGSNQIEAEENILKEKMLQCSSYKEGCDVSCLIDGKFSFRDPFFSTLAKKEPWIKVAFDKPTPISEIIIFHKLNFEDLCYPIVVEIKTTNDKSFNQIFDQEIEHGYAQETLRIKWSGVVDEIFIRPKYKYTNAIMLRQLIVK